MRRLRRKSKDQKATVDWALYRNLKAERRLNLLFRLSGASAAQLPSADTPAPGHNVLPFISRAEHIAWRERWKRVRWVKLSWTPERRDAIDDIQDGGEAAGRLCKVGQ